LSGSRVFVAAIIYYELKREQLRARKTVSIGRLDVFIHAMPGRYVALSDDALRLAAQLWARSRLEGQPTADPKALDVDVIPAAQALTYGVNQSDLVIATMNPKHLSKFVPARQWNEILPYSDSGHL
jgi:hypothetical protein